MYTPLFCLLGFVLWTAVIAFVGIVVPRVASVLAGTAPPEGWPADVPHGSERYRRTMRAHLNCVENLPLFAAVVLTGTVVHAGSEQMDLLATVYLGARVLQSLIHIASGSTMAVNLRFTCYITQLVCLGWMGARVAQVLCVATTV